MSQYGVRQAMYTTADRDCTIDSHMTRNIQDDINA